MARLPIQLLACGLGKQLRMAQSFGTLLPCGRPGRGSWLRIGIASAIALTWGVNHRTEDLPLCLSSLYIRLSDKNFKKDEYISSIGLLPMWPQCPELHQSEARSPESLAGLHTGARCQGFGPS